MDREGNGDRSCGDLGSPLMRKVLTREGSISARTLIPHVTSSFKSEVRRTTSRAILDFVEGPSHEDPAEQGLVQGLPGFFRCARLLTSDTAVNVKTEAVRRMRPMLLASSTLFGGLCVLVVHGPLLARLLGSKWAGRLYVVLYAITLACMAFVSLSDPGHVSEELWRRIEAGESRMPERAHRTRRLHTPIRRYDHYCRWISNCVGLLNHRSFIAMCVGLMLCASVGGPLDVLLLVKRQLVSSWRIRLYLLAHLVYSVVLFGVAGPILRLHTGFICRNELALEWKEDLYYVARSTSQPGRVVPVSDLEVEEYNELLDADQFWYDHSLNPYDKGRWQANCFSFWFTSRRSATQLGEF
mmetsp:Transcript_89729/g.231645  ORF Transcript_89729/g.231645 Transcript_89729/m.231645 type:complete len:355 (-) Transcript_89729:52-1116(-)